MLPPSRSLAAEPRIGQDTVSEAYAELVAEGWLASRQGADLGVDAESSQAGRRPREVRTAPVHDLVPGHPTCRRFRAPMADLHPPGLSTAPTEALRIGDPRGGPAV